MKAASVLTQDAPLPGGAASGFAVPATSSNESRKSWMVAVAAMYGLIFGPSAILVTGFGVLAGPVARGFGWTLGQVSSAVSVIALSIVAIAPLQGYLIDRYGARRVVLGSVVAFAASLLAMSSLPADLLIFHLAWGLMALAAVGLWPAAYLKVVSGWFDRRMGLAIGIANAGIPVGAVLVSPIAAYVIEGWGWRSAFMALAACVATTFPVLYLGFHERASQRAAVLSQPGGRSASAMRELWRDHDFRLLVGSFFLIGFTGTGMVANLVPLLIEAGLTSKAAVGLMSVYGLSSLVARLVTGALLDRVFASRLLNVFVAGALVASLILSVQASGAVLVVAVVLIGFIMGAEFDILAYVLRRCFGLVVFGRAFGAIFAVFQCGAALGAGFLSLSLQRWGSYRPGMLAFAAALAASMLIVHRLRPYRINVFGQPVGAPK